MMLRFSGGFEAAASEIEGAVRSVIATGLRTGDIHTGDNSLVGTSEMGDAIVRAMA
jgi:3-isopropylmalate dehydrogenase